MRTYDKVKLILEEVPATRNSDNLLIWVYADRRGLLEKYDAYGQGSDFHIDEVTFMKIRFETLRRCRQQIQRSHEHLRGSNYKLRHKKASEYPVFLEEDGQGRMI